MRVRATPAKMRFRQSMARHFGDSLGMSTPKPYLSYYDIRLDTEDIKALKSDWLTDSAIAFWEEYVRDLCPPGSLHCMA